MQSMYVLPLSRDCHVSCVCVCERERERERETETEREKGWGGGRGRERGIVVYTCVSVYWCLRAVYWYGSLVASDCVCVCVCVCFFEH